MSLIQQGTTAVAARTPKVIRPTVHGVIDYAHAAFFISLGLFYSPSNKRAATASFVTGGLVLAQSLLTDYRFGAKPLLSFETHGKMDAAFAAGSWRIPALFGFSGTLAARVFEANSLVEGSVVALTDWSSDRAHRERNG